LGQFCGCLYPQSTYTHGVLASAPFEISQQIHPSLRIEFFYSIASQTLPSTC
jgi:hypothetical protein